MKFNLNEIIREIFYGFIFFIYTYLISIYLLIKTPVKSSFFLQRKNLYLDVDQVGPHSSLFITVFILNIYFYRHSFGSGQDIVNSILTFNLQSYIYIISSSIVLTVVADIFLRIYINFSLKTNTNYFKKRYLYAAIYSFQIAVLSLLFFYLLWHMFVVSGFIGLHSYLLSKLSFIYFRLLQLVNIAFVVVGVTPTVFILIRKSNFFHNSKATQRVALVLLTYAALSFLFLYTQQKLVNMNVWLQDKVKPKITQLDCDIRNGNEIYVLFILDNHSKDDLVFEKNSFNVSLIINNTEKKIYEGKTNTTLQYTSAKTDGDIYVIFSGEKHWVYLHANDSKIIRAFYEAMKNQPVLFPSCKLEKRGGDNYISAFGPWKNKNGRITLY